jgi:hypothetical protein
MGMFFPSPESQEELMVKIYKEVNVDPLDVNYFEAHATGTKVRKTPFISEIYLNINYLFQLINRWATLRRQRLYTMPIAPDPRGRALFPSVY